jgi:hypothetical protein
MGKDKDAGPDEKKRVVEANTPEKKVLDLT